MADIIITEAQELDALGRSKDPRLVIGTGHYFETIDALLLSTDILKEGLLSTDVDNSVTWQIYLDGATWKARLYDGTFYVKACDAAISTINISGSPLGFRGTATLDGISCGVNDVVLLTKQYPNLNGIWIVKTGLWTRHPIFDQSADKLTGVTFVVSEGNTYANSQWEFTTIGDVTPATLNSSYQMFIDDTELFMSYTWLNFQLINGNYPSRPILTSSAEVGRFNFNTFADATTGEITVGWPLYLLPNKPYYLSKIDSSSNKVLLGSNTDVPFWVLLEQGDWVEVIMMANNVFEFAFKSNRLNKTLSPATRTTTGKLSLDIPKGYRLYSITSTITGNSGDVAMDYGTASTLSDLDASVVLTEDISYTKIIDSNSVKEIWLTSADWLGGTITVTMLIVQEDEALNRICKIETATDNISAKDEIVHVLYTTTGAVTNLQLKTACLGSKHYILIKDAGGNAAVNNITITTEGAETIDGSATYVMNSNYQAIEIYTDGSNFFIK